MAKLAGNETLKYENIGNDVYFTVTEFTRKFAKVKEVFDDSQDEGKKVIVTDNGLPKYVMMEVPSYNQDLEKMNEVRRLNKKIEELEKELDDLMLILEVSRRLEKQDKKYMSVEELKEVFTEDVFNDNPYAGLSAEELFD